MDRVPSALIRELCGVAKVVDEVIGGSVLRLFGHIERMENYRTAKSVYVGGCGGSRSVGRPRKRWIDPVHECLKKRGVNVGQVRRMVYDRNEW